MKTTFITTLLFVFSLVGSVASASTRAQFMGFQAMVQIFTADGAGGTSPDAANFFKAMNVPSQGSVMGQGKTIQTPDKILTFVCAQGPKGPQCTILFRQNAAVVMNPSQQIISYHVTGALAESLRSKFFLDEKGELHLITTDGLFKVDVEPENFSILYNGQGV